MILTSKDEKNVSFRRRISQLRPRADECGRENNKGTFGEGSNPNKRDEGRFSSQKDSPLDGQKSAIVDAINVTNSKKVRASWHDPAHSCEKD